eukprot:scaffold29347_cov22-Tisochrysis_lutea.AAC.1
MALTHSKAEQERALMPPPPPRTSHAHLLLKPGEDGPPKQVLDEDEYVAHIEAIVERDYFPDIPKLRSQLEWEQAVNTGDPFLIRCVCTCWLCALLAASRSPEVGELDGALHDRQPHVIVYKAIRQNPGS